MRTTSYGASVSSSSPSALAASELARNAAGSDAACAAVASFSRRKDSLPWSGPTTHLPLGRRQVRDEHTWLTVERPHGEPDRGEHVARLAGEHLGPTPLCRVCERVVEREHLARHRAKPLRQLRAARALDDSAPAGRLVVGHRGGTRLRQVLQASRRPGRAVQRRLPHVDRVRQLAGRRRRRFACGMEVDTPAHGDGRDDHRLPPGNGTRTAHVLSLCVEVLDHVGVREGVDLRRDREAEPVPAGQVGPCAVHLGEVDLCTAREYRRRDGLEPFAGQLPRGPVA